MSERDGPDVDLLVVGSGIAGLTAALAASVRGLKVAVLEKTALIGGTSAYSEAMVWAPCSRHASAASAGDSKDAAARYLKAAAGPHGNPASIDAFADTAAEALAFLEDHTEARYELTRSSIDYLPSLSGASAGARAHSPLPYDGKRLGRRLRDLRWPLPSTVIFGGMSIPSGQLHHFYRIGRSVGSTIIAARLFARYFFDRVRGYPRGTSLTGGNGVLAALIHALDQRAVPLLLNTEVVELVKDDRGVHGVRIRGPNGERQIESRRGVVLACGGYGHDVAMMRRTHAHVAAGKSQHSLSAPGATGDALRLAASCGAQIRTDLPHPAAWAPASLVPMRDGPTPFPHFSERSKPGMIAVTRRGVRFVNEATSYHQFVPAMIEACRDQADVDAFLITDHRAQRKYGLGVAPPYPGRLAPHIRSGYLITAGDIRTLAQKAGIDTDALVKTVESFNHHAANGKDPAFDKGGDPYNRSNGDPTHRPNPNVGPLVEPPFYAVRLVAGDLGTFAGIDADADARVLDAAGQPIIGLYAVGSDRASCMGGAYPGAGVAVGAAITFAYRAARHAAG